MFGLLFIRIHYYKYMKRFVIFVLLLLISFVNVNCALADDVDLPATGDLWDNWNTGADDGREAKPVTDEQFDKAIEQVDKKVNKWKNWAQKRKLPKGEEFSQSNETEMINDTYNNQAPILPVLCVPVNLAIGEDTLPVGHYQIKGEKINGEPVLKFYQAHYEMAQFPAVETNDDFGEETISFVKLEPLNDNQIKVMFGSLDFNAYTVIDIKN